MSVVYVISDPTVHSAYRSKRKAVKAFLELCPDDGTHMNYNDEYDTAERRPTVTGLLNTLKNEGYLAYVGRWSNASLDVVEVI